MSDSPPTPRRPFRLQVSLRVLLLLMAVVGVGLTIFRWPWVEDSKLAVQFPAAGTVHPFAQRTTYRRGWTGKPEKHGLEQVRDGERLVHEAYFYDGQLNGPRRAFAPNGRLIMEAHYHEGTLHGAYRVGNGEQWLLTGRYRKGERDGEWRVLANRWLQTTPELPTFPERYRTDGVPIRQYNSLEQDWEVFLYKLRAPENAIVRVQQWQRGQRHGLWKWETQGGEVLSTAEYRDNNLVKWNEQPVVAQFRQWLASDEVHPQVRRLLEAADQHPWTQEYASRAELCLRIEGQLFPIYVEPIGTSDFQIPLSQKSLIPALCELACENGYRFEGRYGSLWMVPNADPTPPFVDPTGVMQIAFDEGSPQAADWSKEVNVYRGSHDAPLCVAKLLEGSSIHKEATKLPFDIRQLWYLGPATQSPDLLYRRTRRDAIGFVLFRSGYRCELRGNELILRARRNDLAHTPFAFPLERLDKRWGY